MNIFGLDAHKATGRNYLNSIKHGNTKAKTKKNKDALLLYMAKMQNVLLKLSPKKKKSLPFLLITGV
jgi:hypothetical protein